MQSGESPAEDHVEERYVTDVRSALERGLAAGLSGQALLRSLAGADPRVVDELLRDSSLRLVPDPAQEQRWAAARRYSAELPLKLPAPNPMTSQWWFTLDGVASVSAKTRALATDGSALFLGAPTAGYHYALCYETATTILDTDPDVVETIAQEIAAVRSGGWTAERYDAADEPPAGLSTDHSVAMVDPPWYPSIIRLFISRARNFIRDEGYIICAIPPRLTRPSIVDERSELLAELLSAGYKILAVEPHIVEYTVPSFELAAYQDIELFTGRSWRVGDLLTMQVGRDARPILTEPIQRQNVEIFGLDRRKLRYFLDEAREDDRLVEWAAPIPEFERTVSTRAFDVGSVAAWGSNRSACRVRDASVARLILEGWEAGHSAAGVIAALTTHGLSEREAERAMEDIRTALRISSDEPGASWRRTPSEMETFRQQGLGVLAAEPLPRHHPHQEDDFRLAFQRDRDRILWSRSLKRLADTTQLFPVEEDDQVRRRLTHSVEVMQLAATVARAFGLDPDLTEAGALAHDVGHAPFGHAGEHALDLVINEIEPRLGGFNHYEHGADVVDWLEDAYLSPGIGGFPGLNLTPNTIECILKHTYFRSGHPLGQSEVLVKSKHRDIENTFGSMEAQAVRIADKLSYLISDLEDGLRLQAITADDLQRCRLFEHPPIDLLQTQDEGLLQRFKSQRRALLRVLMEDVLVATDVRLARLGSLDDVRSADEYTVAFSPVIQGEIDEVWTLLQAGLLHRDGRVVHANLQAGAVVTRLFLVHALRPELVDPDFRRAHEKLRGSEYLSHYRKLLSSGTIAIPRGLVTTLAVERMIGSDLKVEDDNVVVDLYDVILAKDYVAGLTDSRATSAHADVVQ